MIGDIIIAVIVGFFAYGALTIIGEMFSDRRKK